MRISFYPHGMKRYKKARVDPMRARIVKELQVDSDTAAYLLRHARAFSNLTGAKLVQEARAILAEDELLD